MVKNLDYYRSISNATGCKTSKETQSNQIIKRLERDFENPLDVDIFTNVSTNTDIKLEICSQKHSENMGYQEKFKSLITNPIYNGETFYNKKENTYWICTEVESKDYLYYSGMLTRCNWILKWQNEDGEIIERPSLVLSASQYNSGEEATKTVTIGYNQIMVYLILDDETKILKSDKRMFIDNDMENPKPYRITRADTVTKSFMGIGRMSLIMSEDQFNSDTDNKELMICDYITPPSIQSQPIIYSGEATIRNGGIKSFSIETDETISWEIETTDLTNQLQLTIVDNNHCKIKCLNNDNNIDKQFIVKAIGSTVNSSVTISVIGGL